MRVLIVDDEPLSRNTLKNAVGERKDVEVLHSAADAVEAPEMLEEESCDVLLLDIQMPELSGIELAERLNKRRGAIPAIYLSRRMTSTRLRRSKNMLSITS